MSRIIHPSAMRMLDAAGIDHARYAAILDGRIMLTSWQHEDADIASMPRHSAGLGSKTVVMTVFLSDEVAFVTGPDEDATRLTVKGLLPETMRTQLIGRHVTELVAHPMLDVPGLTIADIRTMTDSATGSTDTYVELARVEWPTIGATRRTRRLLDGMRKRLSI